jgi:hypothetical protein
MHRPDGVVAMPRAAFALILGTLVVLVFPGSIGAGRCPFLMQHQLQLQLMQQRQALLHQMQQARQHRASQGHTGRTATRTAQRIARHTTAQRGTTSRLRSLVTRRASSQARTVLRRRSL